MKRSRTDVFSLAAAAALGAAGNSGCTLSTEEACAHLAASRCDHYAACSFARLVAAHGDEATCRERAHARCAPLPTLPGAAVGAADIQACAAAYELHSCDDILLDAPPDACRFAGKKPNGASCAAGAQCQSSFCDVPAEGACGQCAAVRKEGDPCSKGGSPCDLGLHCGDTGACVALGAQGDPCSQTMPCGPRLSCAAGQCVPPAGLGEPCGESRKCDPLPDLFCSPSSGLCEAQEILTARQSCTTGCSFDGYPSCE